MNASKRVLVTGAGGFIGKNLVETLDGLFDFVTPSSGELNLLDSTAAAEYFKRQHFDAVVHCAAAGVVLSRPVPDAVYQDNVKMFLNVADNLPPKTRLIFLGSGAEYGKHEAITNVKESDFGRGLPQDEYGRAKYFASEKIALMDNAVNLRGFGIFGPYEDYTTRFISNIICLALAGRPITVRQNSKFSYVYVKDLARIIAHFINNKPAEKFYNIGSGRNVELLKLAELVKAATGTARPIEVLNPGLNKEYTCDSSLLLAELGGFKFTPFETAIAEMVKWYRDNWLRIDQSKLNFDP